jgi:hypothetical protein
MLHHLSPKLLILVAVAAEGSAAIIDKWGPLLNLGAIGCVLLWFMMQLTPQIKALVAALDRSTRMSGLTIIALEFLPKSVKEQANRIVHEIEER